MPGDLDRPAASTYNPAFSPNVACAATGRAQVAQLVEQRIENPRVGGSNPPLGTIFVCASPRANPMCVVRFELML